MLHEDQIEWVCELLKSALNQDYNFDLIIEIYEYWRDFIDDKDFIEARLMSYVTKNGLSVEGCDRALKWIEDNKKFVKKTLEG